MVSVPCQFTEEDIAYAQFGLCARHIRKQYLQIDLNNRVGNFT